jgi:hypothetical protein
MSTEGSGILIGRFLIKKRGHHPLKPHWKSTEAFSSRNLRTATRSTLNFAGLHGFQTATIALRLLSCWTFLPISLEKAFR